MCFNDSASNTEKNWHDLDFLYSFLIFLVVWKCKIEFLDVLLDGGVCKEQRCIDGRKIRMWFGVMVKYVHHAK